MQPRPLRSLLRSLGTDAVCRNCTRPLLWCGWGIILKSALRLPPVPSPQFRLSFRSGTLLHSAALRRSSLEGRRASDTCRA